LQKYRKVNFWRSNGNARLVHFDYRNSSRNVNADAERESRTKAARLELSTDNREVRND